MRDRECETRVGIGLVLGLGLGRGEAAHPTEPYQFTRSSIRKSTLKTAVTVTQRSLCFLSCGMWRVRWGRWGTLRLLGRVQTGGNCGGEEGRSGSGGSGGYMAFVPGQDMGRIPSPRY